MPTDTETVASALQEHLNVCQDLLQLGKKEAEALRNPAPFPSASIQAERKALLARLEFSARAVSQQRVRWQQLRNPTSESSPELATLVQSALDTIMRVLVIDQENEQSLLRRGLLPAKMLPRAERTQPHFIARTYQRHTMR